MQLQVKNCSVVKLDSDVKEKNNQMVHMLLVLMGLRFQDLFVMVVFAVVQLKSKTELLREQKIQILLAILLKLANCQTQQSTRMFP